MPIQSDAIPHALAGKDLMATAHTGTGKTLAFLVPMIERLLQSPRRGPSKPWCWCRRANSPCRCMNNSSSCAARSIPPAALVIGGVGEKGQLDAIRSGARLLVATPGRLEDFLGRRLVDLRQVKVLVLDEADRMLDMGFLPAIRRIVGVLPRERQTMCFSATLEASVAGLVSDYTRNPVRIALGSTLKPVDSVELQAFEVATSDKFQALCHLLRSEKGRTLVFARTKRGHGAPGQAPGARRLPGRHDSWRPLAIAAHAARSAASTKAALRCWSPPTSLPAGWTSRMWRT